MFIQRSTAVLVDDDDDYNNDDDDGDDRFYMLFSALEQIYCALSSVKY